MPLPIVTGKRARCIEYQPKYVDVIIERWQEQTGLKAERSDGVLWDDIANTAQHDLVMENLSEVFNLEEYNG